EDGIRDFHVTGVQTCALPISQNEEAYSLAKASITALSLFSLLGGLLVGFYFKNFLWGITTTCISFLIGYSSVFIQLSNRLNFNKIGRASCRERVYIEMIVDAL